MINHAEIELFLEDGCGSFEINESMFAKEDFVRELIAGAKDIKVDFIMDELLIKLENDDCYTLVTHI